jgi:parvulin-like peptidyl-prolyl isomerase
MGNDVVIRRIPFAEVAKAKSKGLSAAEGGKYDWTTQGALRSEVLDQALFSLPVGTMSGIIEDEDAFHIIRVTERVPVHRTAFRDAQVEIEKKIRQQRRKKKIEQYYERLRKEIRVWTVFDDAASSGRPTKF